MFNLPNISKLRIVPVPIERSERIDPFEFRFAVCPVVNRNLGRNLCFAVSLISALLSLGLPSSEVFAQNSPAGAAKQTPQANNSTILGNFGVKSGQASLVNTANPNQVTIQQSTNQAVLNWNQLNIPLNSSLQFIQPSSQSVVLNRVFGGSASLIDGSITANGQVWILNPSGVLFGPSSQINVQGLLASTASISNKDFLSGNYTLLQKGKSDGVVSNAGVISVADGGYVVLAANQVKNTGQITAQLGEVALGSGKSYTLDITGDKLINFDVTSALKSANTSDGTSLINNTGSITANGGVVQMTARAANDFVGGVINTGGVVQANTVRDVQGQIFIDGGPQSNGNGLVSIDGTLSAAGKSAQSSGGRVTVTGDQISLTNNATISVTGDSGGGSVLIGGNAKGQGPLPQATLVKMSAGANIDASATGSGNGGQVVLWSNTANPNSLTSIAGTIRAQGGSLSGNGGYVETSGANLNIANSTSVFTSAAKGRAGIWMLDPQDFTIAASGGDITGATVSSNLNNGSVTIYSSSGANSGFGNIYVNDSINWSTNTLTLNAANNIYVNAPLYGSGPAYSVSSASLNVLYGQSAVAAGNTSNFYVNAPIDLPAGHNFSSTIGSDGSITRYTVIVDLGVQQDVTLTTLQGINNNLSGKYALGSNIDASGTSTWNGNQGFIPIGGNTFGAFTGSFNGLGHTVSGLNINTPAGNYFGLFGYNSGNISNIGVVNANIISTVGATAVGAVAGVNVDGTIFNAYSSGTIGGVNTVGGLVGQNIGVHTAGNILNSYSSSSVVGSGTSVGGLVGEVDNNGANSQILNSYSTGSVVGAGDVGGLAGKMVGGVINNSYSRSNVSSSGSGVGGLVGSAYSSWNTITVSNSYSTGQLIGVNYVGGVLGSVGADSYSTINLYNNYSSSTITSVGTSKGAVLGGIGWLNGCGTGGCPGSGPSNLNIVNNNSSAADTSGNNLALIGGPTTGFAYGLVTTTNNSTGLPSSIATTQAPYSGSGVTSCAAQYASLCAGFDFTNTWTIYPGQTTPLLTSFLTPLTITGTSASGLSQVYNGSNVYTAGQTLAYSSAPNANLLGSAAYTMSGSSVGPQSVSIGGFYSNQQGYLITYVNNINNVTVTPTVQATQNINSTSNVSTLVSNLSNVNAPVFINATQSAASGLVASSNTTSSPGTTPAGANSTTSSANNSSVTNTTSTTNTNSTGDSSSSGTSGPSSSSNSNSPSAPTTNPPQNSNNQGTRVAAINQQYVGSQVQAISMGVVPTNSASIIGAATLAPIKTPSSSQDAADPVLTALPTFIPSTSSVRSRAATTAAKTPVIPSLLTLENVIPRAVTQSVDDGILSASGNRSRW